MSACLFNEIKYLVGIGAGAGLLFILIQMLSQTNKNTDFLKYFTPLSLFNPEQLIEYKTIAFIKKGILLLASISFIGVSLIRFQKRDLPI